MYIIIWRNSHSDPHLDADSHGFLEKYPTFESAKEVAERVLKDENESEKSLCYFDYAIYELKN